jgi:hypothetical protein
MVVRSYARLFDTLESQRRNVAVCIIGRGVLLDVLV